MTPPSLDGLLWTLVLVGVVAFVLVEAVVAWFAFRRRQAPDEARASLGFEAIWMLTPAVLLVGLVGWSAHVLGRDTGETDGLPPELTVHVTGTGFAWKIAYEAPAEDGSIRLVDAGWNQLHLPMGRSAKIVLASDDLVHGFWVPQLRVKQDALPGRTSEVVVRPMEEGEFNIVCATLCGNQHYAMRGFVHVEKPDVFERWLASQEQ